MASQLRELEKYWMKRAEGYSRINQEEMAGEQKEKWLRILMKNFPRRKPSDIKILDVGTGPGFFAIILAEQGYWVTAVDYTEQMLRKAIDNAGELADRITWYQMDAQQLDFESEQFDVVVSRNLTWNLDYPDRAYKEWHRVLKKGGLMLNYDANWYGYLFDEEKRRQYEHDRKLVERLKLEDHYTCTDIDAMEAMARKMPLSPMSRPKWDVNVLSHIGFEKICTEEDMGHKVWSRTEQVNYASTPMFQVCAYR